MFTGIVRDRGEVAAVDAVPAGRRMRIRTALPLTHTDIGASIACGGCCLTVTEKGADWFTADIGAETMAKTTLGNWRIGTAVNLEPSLRLGDELGGHMVSGHVDGLATVKSVTPEGESVRVEIEVPEAFSRFIAPKGSVTLDGVSLTVNAVNGPVFGVCIIPHTWNVTTIGAVRPGDKMNLEVDMLARYVARILNQ